jgi:hypothetical protein
MLIIDGGDNKLPSHAHLKVASVKKLFTESLN